MSSSSEKLLVRGDNFDSICTRSNKSVSVLRPHLTPIYASSTYYFDSTEQGADLFNGVSEGFIYSRLGNANFEEVEKKLADLEGLNLGISLGSVLFSSGQAAHSTLFLSHLKRGDQILVGYPFYGGTQDIIQKVLAGLGIESVEVDLSDLSLIQQAFEKNKNIRWVHLESPCNPLTLVYDLEKIINLAHQNNSLVSVDNTFASPYLQQPFRWGADYVVHSTTKYLNGHGTSIGGVVVSRHLEQLKDKVKKWRTILGANSSPFDAFLLNLGIKTLSLRMEKHCFNAARLAEFLNTQKQVTQINYLGLPNHPSYQIAKKYLRLPGAIITFEILHDKYESAVKFQNSLKFCIRAVSLGDTSTLVCHPASTTHSQVEKNLRNKQGISDGLIRVSVGIENHLDIIQDFQQALDQAIKLPKL